MTHKQFMTRDHPWVTDDAQLYSEGLKTSNNTKQNTFFCMQSLQNHRKKQNA